MKNMKILAVAAGFLAAAGLASAGKILVNGSDVGDYSDVKINGNGTIQITSSNFNSDGSSGGTQCTGTFEVSDGNGGCTCQSGYHYDFSDNCVADDNTSGGDTGGDTGGSAPANCDGVPTAGSRDTYWTKFDRFPWNTGERDKFKIDTHDYMAVEFQAPSQMNQAGYIITAAASHAVNDIHTIAISECPGDFNQTNPEGVCRKAAGTHSFWWSTYGKYPQTTCELEPGKTYYLNIKYARGTNVDENTCPRSECGALLSWSNQ